MDDYGVFFPSDVKVLFCGLVVEPQHQLQPAAAFGLSSCRRSLKVFFCLFVGGAKDIGN